MNGTPADATAGSWGGGLPQRVKDLVLFIGSRLSPEDFDALTVQVARAVCSSVMPALIEVGLPRDVAPMGLGSGQVPVAAVAFKDDVTVGQMIIWIERGKLSAVEHKPSYGVAPADWPGVDNIRFPDDNPLPPEPEALFDDLAAVGVFVSSIWDLGSGQRSG